jgi:anti-sigma B factor antagonist
MLLDGRLLAVVPPVSFCRPRDVRMNLAITFEGSEVLVVGGEIDLATASMLEDAIQAVRGTVAVDLSGVTFMDSAGMRVLIREHERREASGDKLVLAALSEPVRRVLEVAGLLEYLGVTSVEDDN